ncbi:amino acid/polyamine transporter I [Xylariales sp. PMI_506]|nr:amino acid/polyamine transporter I [Xylariales sp. PMI_506]
MYRMGKTQELRRNFQFLTMFGFSMILMSSWESALSISTIGLVDGGAAGVIWMSFVGWISFVIINTGVAEMGSMAPTIGGQYHWVSEFAPRKYQRFLSYLMGWFCVLAWQTGCASNAYLAGTIIQGLLVLNYPQYSPEPWHGTVLMIAVAVFAVMFNLLLSRKLPLMEGMVLVVHIFGFFGILITLLVLSPRSSAEEIFTTFSDGGGWGSLGASTLIGMNSALGSLLGGDAAVHMSEELRDAGRTLPRTIIWTTVVNGGLAWIMMIVYCTCMGNVDEILQSPTGYPFLQVFYNSTQSHAATSAMAGLIIFLTIAGNVAVVATASRQLFAFGRDSGLPFSGWFSSVPSGRDVPINAIITTLIFSTLLSLVNLGSATALNSFTSLATTALLSSYMCSTSCILWRRLTNQPLLPSQFSLGKWGVFINIISLILMAFFFVFVLFPPAPDPTAATMNWNLPIYAGVMSISVIFYFVRGRHTYIGPVEYVRKLD